MKFRCFNHRLDFKFDAGTSRGVLRSKNSYILELWDEEQPEIKGIGEAGPLYGLSPEFEEDLLNSFNNRIKQRIEKGFPRDLDTFLLWLKSNPIPEASFQMAFEMAFLNYCLGGGDRYFINDFSEGKKEIPINGLIWMGEKEFMIQQIKEKVASGFTCLKMKIGAIHFEDECAILSMIRREFSEKDLIVRVDANGAFLPNEALDKLQKLAKFDLHSIEQPIMPNQREEMAKLCEKTPLPIALDEELIGIRKFNDKINLISEINPQYLIFKPSLLGGFVQTDEWIKLADEKNIPWWITSALESNIGLNAIAQFTANYAINREHGLGTGSLYHNNFETKLSIHAGKLRLNR